MPSVTVMIWNIQNFGSRGAAYERYKGVNSVLQVEFITEVVRVEEVDLLMLLEVTQTAEPSLDSLLYALNAGLDPNDWCYDWIKGSVDLAAVARAQSDVTTSDHLSWRSSAHAPRAEGCALFWRHGQDDRFTIRRARDTLSEGGWKVDSYDPEIPKHVISLSLRGRPTRIDDAPPPGIVATAGFDPAAPDAGWTWSNYPDVSKYAGNMPRWHRSRRPAWATIDLEGDNGPVPIVGFHAASAAGLAEIGTYVSGLARELYALPEEAGVVATDKAVGGGDYNVSSSDAGAWASAYRSYHEAIGAGADTGAGMTALSTDTAPVRTTIALRASLHGKPIGDPIESDDLADYRRGAIDNIFDRGLTNGDRDVKLLPDDLLTGGVYTGTLLRRWVAPMQAVELGADEVDPLLGPRDWKGGGRRRRLVQLFPNMTDWTAFMNGLQAGEFRGDVATGQGADARQAAVFIHDFVSDHLPVMVTFDTA